MLLTVKLTDEKSAIVSCLDKGWREHGTICTTHRVVYPTGATCFCDTPERPLSDFDYSTLSKGN